MLADVESISCRGKIKRCREKRCWKGRGRMRLADEDEAEANEIERNGLGLWCWANYFGFN